MGQATAQEEPRASEQKNEKKEYPMKDFEFLLDIPLELTVQLGKTRLLIKDLLQLSQGAVVELEKLAEEPMEILINNRLVAKGEVVIVNEKFGIRITEIMSPAERIQQLR